jgi:hypothetical protein
MNLRTHILVLSTLTSFAACKSDKPAKDSPAPGAHPAEPAKPAVDPKLAAVLPKKAPPAFEAWDLPGRAKAWQGAWVSEASIGSPLALAIDGAAATSWDGKAEKKLGFELESPCSALLVEKGADGSSSSTTSHFTVKAGKLVEGLGDAGSRKGKAAIACVSNRVLSLDEAGACLSWSSDFGNWKSEPGKCGFAQKDGKEVFVATIDGHDTALLVDGDTLMSEQLAHKSSASYPDFAAAKAARDAAKP